MYVLLYTQYIACDYCIHKHSVIFCTEDFEHSFAKSWYFLPSSLIINYEGWNFNFGNTPLDWIQELLQLRADVAGRMGPSPTYIHNDSGPSRNGHTQQPVNCQQVQRLGLTRMFTKLEQRSWLKLKQAGAKQQKRYRGLEEACGTAALPYRTVAKVCSSLPLQTAPSGPSTKQGLPKASCDSLIAGNVFYITLGSTWRAYENMNSVGVLYQKLQQRCQN